MTNKVDRWNLNREINADILVDLCGGNMLDTIAVARKYNGIKVTVSLKTLERMAVKRFADAGLSIIAIAEALQIPKSRVERIITKEVVNECRAY